LNNCYRRVIDSILTQTDIYADVKILNNLKVEDIKSFLDSMTNDNRIVSIINNKK